MNGPRPDQLLRFSYSAVSTWLSCRQRWSYQYRSGLESTISDSRPVIGSAVHFALGMAILLRNDEDRLGVLRKSLGVWVEEQLEPFEILPDDAYNLIVEEFEGYIAKAEFIAIRALDALKLSEWETVLDPQGVPMVEWEFERYVEGVGVLTGQIDWVARHIPTGVIWLFDHKIRKTLTNALSEDYNIQMPLYQSILQEDTGMDIGGSITFQVSSSIPNVPKLTKKGEMSRAAIDTDWATYSEALRRAGLDESDYEEMREKLQNKRFYDLTRYYRSRAHVQNIWDQIFLPAAREMRDALYAETPSIVRSMSNWTCKNCDFAQICTGQLRGEDVQYLIQTQYRRRDTSAISLVEDSDGSSIEIS